MFANTLLSVWTALIVVLSNLVFRLHKFLRRKWCIVAHFPHIPPLYYGFPLTADVALYTPAWPEPFWLAVAGLIDPHDDVLKLSSLLNPNNGIFVLHPRASLLEWNFEVYQIPKNYTTPCRHVDIRFAHAQPWWGQLRSGCMMVWAGQSKQMKNKVKVGEYVYCPTVMGHAFVKGVRRLQGRYALVEIIPYNGTHNPLIIPHSFQQHACLAWIPSHMVEMPVLRRAEAWLRLIFQPQIRFNMAVRRSPIRTDLYIYV